MGETFDMYFLTKLRTIWLGILRSIMQSTSEGTRDSDFLRLSLGLPEATAVDGVRLIRTRAIRSVMPGPEGSRAKIMACISPQLIISSRSRSRKGTTGDARLEADCLGEGMWLKSMIGAPWPSNGMPFCVGIPANMSEALSSSR